MQRKQIIASSMQGLGLSAAVLGAYMLAAGLAVIFVGAIAVAVGIGLERRSGGG